MSARRLELTGQTFNLLTAIERINSGVNGKSVWRWQCQCGKIRDVACDPVIRGHTKSCGCLNGTRTGLESLAWRVFTDCHYNDADITFEQYLILSAKNCHYCNSSPSRTRKYKEFSFTSNGLDRADNSKKHSFDNVVPCCFTCNQMKKALGYKEFLNHIEKIYNNRIKINQI